ncbi:poly(rC)-binding protein 3-like [Myzus persicae]|uniref:poly(rC)-binding protein 3-like n=1 Tax=Myzus persicae TaxID=13164 RepID=UPI000B933313|nr:poly(rC)-binding protein 3-like [Myzus persicae]
MKNVQGSSKKSRFSELTPCHNVYLTIRILFHGREVGNVIGKGGETIKFIRDQSGARVEFTHVTNLERIAIITGTTHAICKATELIGLKVKEFFERENFNGNGPKQPLTFKLIVPAYQCSFIIGKRGYKIKKIRESSGAYIQVSSNMLPNSTERLVSITGTTDKVSQCIYNVCNILLYSPRCSVISYEPPKKTAGLARKAVFNDFGRYCQGISSAKFAAHGFGAISTGSINVAALHALAGSQLRTTNHQNYNGGRVQTNTETISITVPNDLIGCIIGRKGSKITKMQQISGAIVHVTNRNLAQKNGENRYRHITITGNKDSVSIAKHLIEVRLERLKANRKGANSSSSPNDGPAIPMAQLFEKPGTIHALSSLSALGDPNYHFESSSGTNQSPPIQTTGFNRTKNYF